VEGSRVGRNPEVQGNLRWGINLREDDKALVELIDNYFGNIGTFTKRQDKYGLLSTTCYYIEGAKKAEKVIEHFDAYPMLGKKRTDFEYYKEIARSVQSKEHLKSPEEYLRLVGLADEMRINRVKEMSGVLNYREALRRSSGSSILYSERVAERFPEFAKRIEDIVQPMLKDFGFESLSE